MTTLFVTGTGTDIGKTFVTVTLVVALRERGLRVRALKPVASGFDPEHPEISDTGQLAAAQGIPLDEAGFDALSPWRFRAPLSPDMAAEREGRSIDFEELVKFSRAGHGADITLIEGIGGVMVPLDDRHTVLDWIAELGAPVLLVTGSYLGTLSHTLTAVGMLTTKNCTLAGLVISESLDQPVPLAETKSELDRFTQNVPLIALPRTAPASRASHTYSNALLDAIMPALDAATDR